MRNTTGEQSEAVEASPHLAVNNHQFNRSFLQTELSF